MTPLPDARIEAAAERLYALLPAHIRGADAANGLALKALIQVLASGSAEIDREIATLYDSMFVETAPEAALADLAALVASEPLRPLPPGSGYSTRGFVANTIRYRRGKGTARVLEALSNDVGRFGAVAVEYFMRLARTQNLIDVRPERPGTADLVPGTTAARTATGSDRLPRLVDVRSIARAAGRHHVPHIGVHLLRPIVPVFPAPDGTDLPDDRLAAVPLARPWLDGGNPRPGYFQLSAQPGRVLRLFNPDRRSQDDTGRVIDTDLPDRLRRLDLHLETERRRRIALGLPGAALGESPWFDAEGHPFTIFLRAAQATTFTRVRPEEILIANLDLDPTPAGARPASKKLYPVPTAATPAPPPAEQRIRCGFDPVTGRLIVAQPEDIAEVRIAYGTGIARAIGAGPQERNTPDVPFDIVDTDKVKHFIRIVDATQPETGAAADAMRPVKKLATALGDWAQHGAGKRGLIVLTRCDREGAAGNATGVPVAVHPDSELHIVSAKWQGKTPRPGVPDNPDRHGYVKRNERRFTIDAPLEISAAAAPPAGGRAGVLVLDGVELTLGLSIRVRSVSRLLIRHCVVRAPNTTAISTTAQLVGTEVAIDRSIVGRINLNFGSDPASGSVVITGSIVSADGASGTTLNAPGLDGRLHDVTIFGTSSFKSLEATNVIFTDAAAVVRSQSGCVRYSSIASGSAMPRRFRCQPDLAQAAAAERKGADLSPAELATVALAVTPLFLDTSLDEPTVAILHPLTPDTIRLGGENDTEMGVFAQSAEGLRAANLTSLFEDYLPFGLEAGLIDDTRSTAVAARRNRP